MSEARSWVPTAAALSVFTTMAGGCQDPLLANWEALKATFDGNEVDFPIVIDDGYGYVTTERMFVRIDDRGVGTLDRELSTSYAGSTTEETYAYDIYGSRMSRGVWDLTIPDAQGLSLSCTAEKRFMDCAGADENGNSYALELVAEGSALR